ncbi:MAG TPA: 2-phosphosulfolactate phosphatase, partial [Lacipirellulaceae bacterium]|nr:2-phosphosulfolactate phosphatase [Lacipirellulaceae bacterium]
MPRLDLYPLAKDAPREALADATVIVVDMLRASTTIATALAAGAECVMPFAEIDETLAAAQRFGGDRVLRGGEGGGRLLPGFARDTSPAEYTPGRAADRRILFTTTNGARALQHVREARRVLVGAAINASAVARAVELDADVAVLGAGTDGVLAMEDLIAGGVIIDAMIRRSDGWSLNRSATAMLEHWQGLRDGVAAGASLIEVFAADIQSTDGARNLISIG